MLRFESSERVVTCSSIMSMAGITVARDGVEREKNSVASLKIYNIALASESVQERERTSLQGISQLLRDLPLSVVEFKLPKICFPIGSHLLDSCTIVDREIEHVER